MSTEENKAFVCSWYDVLSLDANLVTEHFEELPNQLRNRLLLILSEKDPSCIVVADFITSHFDKIPKKVRNQLLINLSKKESASSILSEFVVKEFNTLNENLSNKLIINLSENYSMAWDILRLIAIYFDRLNYNTKQFFLLELAEKNPAAAALAKLITYHNDLFIKEIRKLLSVKKESCIAAIIRAMETKEVELMIELEKLLIGLCENDQVSATSAWEIVVYSGNVSEEIKKKLIIKLQELPRERLIPALWVG